MQSAFGDQATAAAHAFARAANTAQNDGTEAKVGSRLPTNEPYGATVWLAFARETASELENIGAATARPKGCRYRLAILNGTLALAVKLPADSRGIEHIRIASAIRQRILCLSGDRAGVTLDFGDDFELVDDEDHAVTDAEFGGATRVILVVLEGSARGGVESIHIGDVSLGDLGHVVWLHREQLPVEVSADMVAGLVVLELEQSTSFASADMPEAPLGLVAEDGVAENVNTKLSEVNDSGTKGAVNDES